MTTATQIRTRKTQPTPPPRALSYDKVRNLFGMMVAELERHVFGQAKLVREVVQAILSGQILLIVGPSGVGKTHVVEVAIKIFGLKGEVVPLNPEVTAEEITGFPIFDRASGKMVHHEGPFGRGNQLVVLDEENRTSDKNQNGQLYVLNNKEVVIDGQRYPLAQPFTVIMTMNPPEVDGTRDLISALVDRIDVAVWVGQPNINGSQLEAFFECLKYWRNPPEINILRGDSASAASGNGHQPMSQPVAEISDARQTINQLRSYMPDQILRLVCVIVRHFIVSGIFAHEPSIRTLNAMAQKALIQAITQDGRQPQAKHVWDVASQCLLLYETEEYMTTADKIQVIDRELKKLKDQATSLGRGGLDRLWAQYR